MFEKEKREFFQRGGRVKLQTVIYSDSAEESLEVDEFLIDFTEAQQIISGFRDGRQEKSFYKEG